MEKDNLLKKETFEMVHLKTPDDQEEAFYQLENQSSTQKTSKRQKQFFYFLSILTCIFFLVQLGNSLSSSSSSPTTSFSKPPSNDDGICPKPPLAFYQQTIFGQIIQDPFHYQNITDPRILDYIQKENNFTTQVMKPLSPLRAEIETELEKYQLFYKMEKFWTLGRYFYFKYQSLYYRWERATIGLVYDEMNRPDCQVDCQDDCFSICTLPDMPCKCQLELILNTTQFNSSYLQLGVFEPSPDGRYLAYSIDTEGSENYQLYIRDLFNNSIDQLLSSASYYTARWYKNDLYFNAMNEFQMPVLVYKWTPGSNEIQLIYHELDPAFVVDVFTTSDDEILGLSVYSQSSMELLYLNQTNLISLFGRLDSASMSLEHFSDSFLLLSNQNNSNYALYRCLVSDCSSSLELIYADPDVYIQSFQAFSNYIVLWVWQKGVQKILILSLPSGQLKDLIEYSENRVFGLFPGSTRDFTERNYFASTDQGLIFTNTSYLQPPMTFEYSFNDSKIRVLQVPIQNESFPYTEERIYIPSYDGQLIPMDLVKPNQTASSTLAFVYGSYGSFYQPSYLPFHFSLLSRGIQLAIIHPRGDADMGPQWYSQGKNMLKLNTFLDTRRCLIYLKNITNNLGLFGRSAGGLVMGAAFHWFSQAGNNYTIYNESIYSDILLKEFKEALFGLPLVKLIVSQVGYVDVLWDMLNSEMSWSAYEWTEWGNPTNQQEFYNIINYSPYEQFFRQRQFPASFFTAGFKDTRVSFLEPTKWMAKVRKYSLKCSLDRPQLLRVTDNGHYGGTGKEAIQELIETTAFIIQYIK